MNKFWEIDFEWIGVGTADLAVVGFKFHSAFDFIPDIGVKYSVDFSRYERTIWPITFNSKPKMVIPF